LWPDCWRLRCINHNNQPAPGFPLQYGHSFMGSPAVYDIDEDGKLELMVATYDELFYVYDLETTQWDYPKFRFDPYNTGTYDRRAPSQPYMYVEKSINGNDALLRWNRIVTDTFGNRELMYGYVVYRSTSPDFGAVHTDSIGIVVQPDTTYRDVGALNGSASYYYCVRAVDWARNKSECSNVAYVFHKPFIENPSATDKNWVSLPWDNGYSTVSDVTDDVSPGGDPLTKVTRLRDEQTFESWLWDADFLEWYGVDFVITSGEGYEMVSVSDTVLLFVGVNDPQGLVVLNENAANTDKNWVSIPYHAVYDHVSDITSEYSPGGDPLTKVTSLQDDQLFESWLWDADFLEWYGADFAIERGRGYEFVTIVDTVWDPTEYAGGSKGSFAHGGSGVEVHLGDQVQADRAPGWHMADGIWQMATEPRVQDTGLRAEGGDKAKVESQKAKDKSQNVSSVQRNASSVERQALSVAHQASGVERSAVSHVVRGHVGLEGCRDLVFTVFCLDRPDDVLTEAVVGCGWAEQDGNAAFWCDVGNFAAGWSAGDECVVIVEALREGCGQYAVMRFVLDGLVDIQELGEVVLAPLPQVVRNEQGWSWSVVDDEALIGYSVYVGEERLNTVVIEGQEYCSAAADVVLRLVLCGGYETVYGTSGVQAYEDDVLPTRFCFTVSPNPFVTTLGIRYALPQACDVRVAVYDVTGRQVATVVCEPQEPGYYDIPWSGHDEHGRTVAAGIYFVRIQTPAHEQQHKVIRVQ